MSEATLGSAYGAKGGTNNARCQVDALGICQAVDTEDHDCVCEEEAKERPDLVCFFNELATLR